MKPLNPEHLSEDNVPPHHRRRSNPALFQYVVQRLEAPPQTIVGRVGLDYPHDSLMRMSPEAIYRWIYLDAKEGGELYTSLAFRQRRRRKQRSSWQLAGLNPRVNPDGQQPAVVGRRRRFGDWEGDTLYGSRAKNCLLTHVERKSRYLIAGKLPDRKAISVEHLAQNAHSRQRQGIRRLQADRASQRVARFLRRYVLRLAARHK